VILGEVVGRLWNDRQVAGLEGHRFVVVRAVDGGGTLVAADLVEVAAGNVVLVATDEAAQAAVGQAAGIDAAVVSLVGGADALGELRTAGAAA
jgi:ethanolamine utilization protein EutN